MALTRAAPIQSFIRTDMRKPLRTDTREKTRTDNPKASRTDTREYDRTCYPRLANGT
jgi:hypothetical protein